MHIDSLDILEDLDNEQVGMLFRAIKSYQLGEEITLDPMVKIAFSPFRNQFVRDAEKYENTCKARAEAGSKGGKQKVANASKRKQKVANVADSDSKNKSDSDSDSKNKELVVQEKQVSSSPVIYWMPLNDGSDFEITQEQFDKWSQLYQAVNIDHEIRKMIGWLDANKSKRKTRKGFLRFANGWISKVQDNGGSKGFVQQQSNDNWHEDLGL